MGYELPSLNALRAFEAVARHGSFKEAAGELHVTPGAVSQQIKALEDELAERLFLRLSRGVELTEAGRELFPSVRLAMQGMDEAVRRLRDRGRGGALTVSVAPSLAVKWLVPRLGRFRELHPEIDVRIGATTRLVDFSREDVDVAIRCGPGTYPGLHSVFLMHEDMFPVCSPALLAGEHPLRTADDLRHHTLLHIQNYQHEWPRWLTAHGVTDVDATRGPAFSDAGLALQAAVEGQGVAITYTPLAATDLAEGRLVRPFPGAMESPFAYHVVCPEETAERPKIAAFRDWVLAEARADGQLKGEDVAPAGTGAAAAVDDSDCRAAT